MAADATQTISRTKGNWSTRLYQVLLAVGLLLGWEFASGPLIETVWISKPTLVAQQLYEWFTTGFIYPHLLATFQEMVLGLAAGAGLGILLGLGIGLWPWLAEMLDPFISAAYALPRVAIYPLLLLWFGFGLESKVALIALMVFFVLFLNTLAGIKEVDRDLVESMKVLGASQSQILKLVILPSIVSFILAGMAIAVPYSLMGALVAEMMAGSKGLGFLVVASQGNMDLTGLFAAAVIVAIWGLVASEVVARQGERLIHWKSG
jgi:NitT/TauT family transport system permease protein